MKRGWLLLAGFLLVMSASVCAHRLDEYLEATTISVARDHLTLQLRLTPGVTVAPQLLADIGISGDGPIPYSLQQSYAQQVRRDLRLSIDDAAQPLRLISETYPTAEAMRNGVGDILLTFDAPLPAGGPTHRLAFENHHRRAIAVYLVNCLVPGDPRITIGTQDRNVDQSRYQLDFSVGGMVQPTHATVAQQASHPVDDPGIIGTFFVQGVHHILTGYDHLLFGCALVLAVITLWDLVKVVTAFTVAHSITLTLAALNLVHLPTSVVEPLISASIVFVALQNVFWPGCARGRSRLLAAFFFGLFHGLVFAGGLLDIMHAMPGTAVLLAILGFSLGVEVGHQIVLLPLFGLLSCARRSRRNVVSRAHLSMAFQRIGSAGIAMAGLYYLGVALIGVS
ncbi:HupE/UreJ family protein [Caballeronia sp. HLA56]